jgi:riboflavin biosynthesis pyrimidine reductase
MISPAYGLALKAQISSVQELADSYGAWEGIRTNHVVDSNGNFWGSDLSSRSISTTEDRFLLMALRAKADLVVVDARTARDEQYDVPSSGASLAIFSATGDFTGIPAVEKARPNCFLFSPEMQSTLGAHHHQQIQLPGNPLSGLSEWATEQGLPAVLLEAGPTFSGMAFRDGLVANSALTISIEGLDEVTAARMHPFDPSAKLLSLANAEGASFTYWSH